MRAYTMLTVQTCHKRNAFAIGGMAAQIPVKNNPELNEAAFASVRADKEREARDGHDGTWVAHPGLVPVALQVFDQWMPEPNQVKNKREDVHVRAADLLAVPDGSITKTGLRLNTSVGIRYIASWLGGSGALPIFNLMEDTATAEISRVQVWQWLHNPKGVLDDGRNVTISLFEAILKEELNTIQREVGEAAFTSGRYQEAAELFHKMSTDDAFVEFLTIPGYERLCR